MVFRELMKWLTEIIYLSTCLIHYCFLKVVFEGWRDGSEVKRTDCCSGGPEFNSQQPHDGSHPSIMRSGAQNTIYIINKFKKKRIAPGAKLEGSVSWLDHREKYFIWFISIWLADCEAPSSLGAFNTYYITPTKSVFLQKTLRREFPWLLH